MQTSEAEKRMSQRNGNVQQHQLKANGVGIDRVDADVRGPSKVATDERLVTMAAIAKEMAEISEDYSTELASELHRLNLENQALRELLAINTTNSANSTSQIDANPNSDGTPVSSTAKQGSTGNASASSKTTEEWAGVPIAFE